MLVTYLSGIVDSTNRVRAGGYPGAFREMLGVFGEEFFTLQDGESVALSNDTSAGQVAPWHGITWSEKIHADDSETMARYVTGQLAGSAAITRRTVGQGQAWYVSTRLQTESLGQLVDELLHAAGIRATVPVSPGLEAVRRVSDDHSYLFLLNHSAEPIEVDVCGVDLSSGGMLKPKTVVPAGGVRVVREASRSGEARR